LSALESRTQLISDAQKEASRILEEAQLAAAELNARAEREAGEIVARAEAAAVGVKAEAARAGQELGFNAVVATLREFQAERARLLSESKDQLLRLALRIAEKIVGREIQTNSATILDIVAQALEGARSENRIVVRVHPDDVAQLKSDSHALVDSVGRPMNLSIIADQDVGRGGCIVKTELGTIDARLETQLRVLGRALSGNNDDAPPR